MTSTEFGPVSTTLESELRTTVRKHGIVLWLDPITTTQDLSTGSSG